MSVLTLGETMALVVTPVGTPLRTATTARLSTAGAESTVAVGLARLGVDVAWAGVVGEDELGSRVLRDLTAEGVDVRCARRDPAPTGLMVRELRTAEVTRVLYHRAGSAGSRLGEADVDAAFAATTPDLVHLTGITPALSASAEAAARRAVALCRDRGVAVSLDVNLRRTLPGASRTPAFARDVLPDLDVLFVGDDELDAVTDRTGPDTAADLAAAGVREVVVKHGAAGASARLDGVTARTDALPVAVRDVVGAGDGFVAGYLAARVLGLAVDLRLRWGAGCAAATVGSDGDWEGLPTRPQLEDLLDGTGRIVR